MGHIHFIESEIVARNEHFWAQDTPPNAPLRLDRDLAVHDLKNLQTIFAPVRCLLNDVLLRIFQMSFDPRVIPDVKITPWIFDYLCHHWRGALSRFLWTIIHFVRYNNLSSGQLNLCEYLLSLSRYLPL